MRFVRAVMSLHLLALLVPGRVWGTAQPPHMRTPTMDFADIDRYAEQLLRADRVPGAAIAVVHRGRVVHVRGFGVDGEGRPITGRTSFVLGSMSKSITALAVMQLVEQGRIGLDEPVRRYLPAFTIASSDSGASITVRHLLLHTSGIPHNAARGRGRRRALRNHVEALRRVAPTHPPGVVHAYASPNYLVLGAIVEAVSGLSFAAYVRREIFGPLQMQDSFTDRAQALARQFAGGNVYVFGFPVRSRIPAEPDRLPTAGLMSSAEDLARFLSMQLQQGHFEDTQLLGAESVAQMHTGGAPSDGFSYAFGWRDGNIAGTRAIHHGGIVPDFRGKMVMLPDSGWGVVVLTNASSVIPWPIPPTSHRLADAIAARLAGQPLPPATSRHRWFFGAIGVAMLALLVAQVRTFFRARQSTSAREDIAVGQRVFWRAMAIDGAFLAFVALVPGLAGLTWLELLNGAPDVAWWLIAMAILGTATLVVRLKHTRQLPSSEPQG